MLINDEPVKENQIGLSGSDFLSQAKTGRIGTGWFLAAFLFILTGWQVIGSIPYLIIYQAGLSDQTLISFLALNLSFVVLILSIIVAMRIFHRRSWISLITPNGLFDLRKALLAAGLWTVICLLNNLLDAALHPGSYQLTFQAQKWFAFLPAALLLTPLQAGAEEIFFRGYLLQQTSLLSRNRWVLAFLSGIIFALPHFFNPEMRFGMVLTTLFYFAFGFFMAIVTIKANCLEYALGIHAANNLTTVLFANYSGSALPSPSIFTASIVDPLFNLVAFITGTIILWLVLFRFIPAARSNQVSP